MNPLPEIAADSDHPVRNWEVKQSARHAVRDNDYFAVRERHAKGRPPPTRPFALGLRADDPRLPPRVAQSLGRLVAGGFDTAGVLYDIPLAQQQAIGVTLCDIQHLYSAALPDLAAAPLTVIREYGIGRTSPGGVHFVLEVSLDAMRGADAGFADSAPPDGLS